MSDRPRAPRPRRRRIGLVALVVAIIGVPVAVAADAVQTIERGGASVTDFAERTRPPVGDFVSVYNSGALRSNTEQRAFAVAERTGATFAIRGSASIAMQRIRRGGTNVQVAPDGMSFPMGTTVLDKSTIATLMGLQVAGPLDANTIIMSELTASLRGAQSGDVVVLRSSGGAEREFTIGAVVADAITGGTELLIVPEAAARLGLDRKSGVILWNFGSRERIDAALASAGLESAGIRIRRSWDAFDPDSTLGMARTKSLLGEFAYRVNSNGSVTLDPAWKAQNLSSLQYLPGIRRDCHRVVQPQMKAAIDEIVARGLSGVFDLGDWSAAGGCYVARFNRLTPDSTIGFLSRHSWGMAMDTNTVSACQGCAPPSFATRPGGCTVVQIFRKHGFAWGGNFLTPDGMHFEYVGAPRDQFPYPSRWCANEVTAKPGDEPPAESTQRATMFDDAGLITGHAPHH